MSFSIKTAIVSALAAVATAVPSGTRFSDSQMKMYEMSKRQNEEAADAGLSDVDILQFALTLEWLEGTFYQQGMAQFPDTDFQALGLSEQEISDLKDVGATEFTHASFLISAIAGNGVQPVTICEYDFGFTDAAAMLQTAAVLESVGVSAYLGAAPLLEDADILAAAGSILTVEARHQTFIRAASRAIAFPQAFDTPLGPRAVFSLAAPFIVSCPEGSNLQIEPFPTLELADPVDPSAVAIDQTILLNSEAASEAVACAFTAGGVPGGTKFTEFQEGVGCVVPQAIEGVVYVSLASDAPLDGVLTDEITVAGPAAITIS